MAAFIFEKQAENANNSQLPPPPVSTDSEFLINVMESGIDTHYTYYPQLQANAWHKYCGSVGNAGWPGVYSDNINTDPSIYGTSLLIKIDSNRAHGFRSIMERPKSVHLAWSQRSDYQCESLAVGSNYWFYAYNIHQTGRDTNDNSFNGNGARVRYCSTGTSAGYVVKGLKSNREQANKQWTFMQRDDSYEWYVMPRIRIDTSFVRLNPDSAVCSIIMLDWDGHTIDSVNILAKYFRVQNGQYNGNYIEEFNFPSSNQLIIPPGDICPGAERNFMDWWDTSVHIETDFRVYWYGLCDMWIDYVRVENLPAHEFFNSTIRDWDSEVRAEAEFADHNHNSANPIPNNFYLEEFEFNMVPSIKHFNDLVRDQTQNRVSLMVNLSYGVFKYALPPNPISNEFSPQELDNYLVSRANIKYIVQTAYPLEGFVVSTDRESYHPTTLSTHPYSKIDGILSYPTSVSDYEYKLQEKFDFQPAGDGGFITVIKKAEALTQIVSDLNIILLEQAHLHYAPIHMLKEPSNEELKVMANVGITYGAKGIMYFAYDSHNQFSNIEHYQRGLTDTTFLPRTQSVYGQNKWEGVKEINSVHKKWSPYIMSFDNANRHSYIYRLETERNALKSNTYFADVVTYKPGTGNPGCPETDNPGGNPPTGLIYECNVDRYLQVATFENTEPNTKYFMIVNRRCSPFINDSSEDDRGGRRFIRVRFDANSPAFANFNNWKIINLEDSSTVVTFDKQTSSLLDLDDWYLPGEGRLYKIAPVMQEGGTLVVNEVVSSSSFNCNGDVYNGGKNVTINPNVTVNFAGGVKWDFLGGEFICGNIGENPVPLPVTLTSQSTPSRVDWKGIILSQCSNVEIENTIISYISNTSTALQMIDCNEFIVSHNTFNLTNLDSVIAIGVDYLEPWGPESSGCSENCEEGEIYTNGFINNNVFNTTSSTRPTLRLSAFTLYVVSLMADRNTFNSTSGSIAMFLSNVAAGNLKNNKIYNYKTGINILSLASYADLYNNMITGDSIGVQIADGTINLGTQDYYYTGGFNRITSNTSNIRTHEGYFSITEGLNTFDMNDTLPHLKGTFATNLTLYENAIYNCFKTFNSISNPREDVNCAANLSCTVNFEFNPNQCAIEQTDDYYVIDILGDGKIFDTIWTNGGGGGGANLEFGISDLEFKKHDIETASMRELYNSICIEMRKRNFSLVHSKCMELLNNYIDSTESMDALSKLYLADLILDSNGSKISQLKTFFETLILQNGDNEDLVRKLFYLDQKCKVALGLYESAMTGFQEIINQNPYSYEGLVASWDYAATSLLDSLHGSGGGTSNYQLSIRLRRINDQILNFDDPRDKYDTKSFTKEDRKVIKENVFKSYKSSRDKEVEIIKSLETKVAEGKASESEKNELKTKRVLSEIVKANEPVDIAEHIKTVNDNIQTLFGSDNNNTGEKDTKNIIPMEYQLSQNYPNPFNPITKISFDLPNDAKVKLVVYDLLGRGVKSIVNGELSMGRHEFIFDGSNFASGVYFYKLSAGDFTAVKRMVLVK